MANEINIGINTTSDLSGLNKVDESVKSLKTQLKEAQANVNALSEKFGATSQQAIAAAKSAAELKDKIGDAKALTDAFNPDAKMKSLSGALTGVAGGFSAVTGMMGLMGKESKDVEKAILKVQSAMAIASGVQALGESIDSFKQLNSVIKDSIILQKLGAAAQKLWNAAMASNPIGATIFALTALVSAGYLLIKMFQTTKPAVDQAAESLKKHTKETEKNNEAIKQSIEKKKQDEEYQYRLMKAQGLNEITILKTAVANAKATQAIANKNYQTTHEIALAEYLEIVERKKLKALLQTELQETKNQGGWTLNVEARIEANEKELKSLENKYKVDSNTNKLRVDDVKNANAQLLAAERNLNIGISQEKTDAIKKAAEEQKKADDDAASKRKQQDEKNLAAAKTQAEKDKELKKKYIQQQEDLIADSETKKAILLHRRNTEEIEQIKDTNAKKIASENEYKANIIRMNAAIIADKEAEYNKSVEFMELADAGYQNDLQKQLEHYQHLLTIQEDYGKSTIEIEDKIKLTQKQIDDEKKQLHEKYIRETEADTYKAQQKKLEDQYNADIAEINLIKDKNQKIKLLNDLKIQYDADSQKLEIAQRKSTIESIGQMAQTAADIGSLIADRIAGENVQDKQRKKTAVRVGAASSIAGVIGSTASANAGFLANPASVATLGLAAAVPIASSIASSTIAIANILNQKNKAIREIDDAGGDTGGGGKATPSKFATGGLVQGMGTSTSDSIMANLSNGESVINAKSTAMFGNLLSNINQMGGGVSFGNQNNANPIFKTYVVASEMTSQIEANLKLKQIARL
jgi:uncharacterized membrane protein YfcA